MNTSSVKTNNQVKKTQSGRSRVRMLAVTAMLAALSYVLAFLEFSVPFCPSFAKLDFSDFPALVAAFVFGPLSGILVELIKNALQLITTSTGGIGEFANFVMGGSYVLCAGFIYKFHKTKKGAWTACLAASVVMGIVAAFMNYFVLLPLFEQFMPVDQLIASFSELIPFIKTKLDIVLYNAFPFNLVKGLLISVITMLVYKKLTPILKGSK